MRMQGKVAVVTGGAAGIGRLAASAMEGIARQPNAAGDIRGAMIVAAGLIEGVTFFALIVTILIARTARNRDLGATRRSDQLVVESSDE